jgi:cellulose synthase/poly-beta-1,6-N-acetylglucosamine synthase-like glycosyltransferase
MTAFLFVTAVIFLAVAAHSFVTYPLSLLVLRTLRRRHSVVGRSGAGDSASSPTFAVCMCAYNEERVIEEKLRNLLALREREPGLQVHVYVDAATDGTSEILRRYADRIDLHVAPERHGKTHGMNLLSARASADVLIFTDANVMLDLDCIRDLRAHFADPSVGDGVLGFAVLALRGSAQASRDRYRIHDGCRWIDICDSSQPSTNASRSHHRRHVRVFDDDRARLSACAGERRASLRGIGDARG